MENELSVETISWLSTIKDYGRKINELSISIAEGECILRSGHSNGKKISPEYRINVTRQVEKEKYRLGLLQELERNVWNKNAG